MHVTFTTVDSTGTICLTSGLLLTWRDWVADQNLLTLVTFLRHPTVSAGVLKMLHSCEKRSSDNWFVLRPPSSVGFTRWDERLMLSDKIMSTYARRCGIEIVLHWISAKSAPCGIWSSRSLDLANATGCTFSCWKLRMQNAVAQCSSPPSEIMLNPSGELSTRFKEDFNLCFFFFFGNSELLARVQL